MNLRFFHEFHVFLMNFTFFSYVSRVFHVFVHARGFEPRTKENIGNLVRAHIFGRCIPILQPKLVKKEVFKDIFAKMYSNTANQKDCGMDPPEGEKFPVIALVYQHRRSASALFL